MRKSLPALGILLAAASAASAQMVYEPFDYGSAAVGTPIGASGTSNIGYINPMTGTSWADTNTGTAGVTSSVSITGGSLSYAGLMASAGDSATTTNASATRSPRIGIAPNSFNTNRTLYYSFLLNVTDMTGLTTATGGQFIEGFNNSAGTQSGNPTAVGSRLYIRKDADGTHYDLGTATNSTTVSWDITPGHMYSQGQTLLVVGAYQINGNAVGGTDDTSSLWVNPDASSFGGAAPTPVATNTKTDIASGILSFVEELGGSGRPAGIQIDELRVDQSWSQVTPAAGTSWAGGTSGNWSASLPSGAGNFVNFTPGGGNVTVDGGGQTAGTINIKSAAGYSIGGATLTLTPTAGGVSAINVMAQMDPTGPNVALAGSHVISAPVALGGNTEVNVATNQTLNLSGPVSGSAGFIKYGAGTLVLSGNNTFVGGLVMDGAGTVEVTSDASFGAVPATATTNITLNSGTLKFDSGFNPDPNRTIQLLPPVISTSQVGGGNIDTGANNVTLAGLITSPVTAGSGSFPGTFTGGGPIVKQGSGTLTITNTGNTYQGMFIQQGVVNVALSGTNDGAFGALPAPGKGTIVMQGGTLQLGGAGTVNAYRNMNIDNAGGTIDTNGNDVTFAGAIVPFNAATGGLTKTGAGTLTLPDTAPSGHNTFSGPITIAGGTVSVPDSFSLGSGAVSNSLNFNGGTLLTTGVLQQGRQLIVGTGGGTLDAGGNADVIQGGTGQVFNGPFTVTNGGLTFNRTAGTTTVGTGGAFTIASTASVTVAGTVTPFSDGTHNMAVSNNGTLSVTSTGHAARAISGSGSTTVSAGASLAADAISQAALTLQGGGTAALRAGGGISSVNSLSIDTAGSSSLDLNNNTLWTSSTPIDTIRGYLLSGRASGAWTGPGIISSAAQAANDPKQLKAIGYREAIPTVPSPAPSGVQNESASVIALSLVLQSTYYGDLNMDGVVNADDYALMDRGFAQNLAAGTAHWVNGDLNYDGVVDSADYLLMDTTFGRLTGQLSEALLSEREAQFGPAYVAALTAAVPEPATLGLLAAALPLAMRRRRRN